jgi:hypothetical protein
VGEAADAAAPADAACPKCHSRSVFVRYDIWLKRERYCASCGWTPLTVLSIHQVEARELARSAALRAAARQWVWWPGDLEAASGEPGGNGSNGSRGAHGANGHRREPEPAG